MAKKDEGPSTFPVTAPDGSTIHVPNLPRVGEPYHKPDPHASEAREPAVTTPSPHHVTPAPPTSHGFQDFAYRVGAFASSAFKTLLKDDFDKVVSPSSSPLERIEGAASLGSWVIPEDKLAELAAHAAEKAAEFVASHAGEIQSAAASIGAVVRPSSRTLTDAERNANSRASTTSRISWDRRDSPAASTETGIILSRRITRMAPVSFRPSRFTAFTT